LKTWYVAYQDDIVKVFFKHFKGKLYLDYSELVNAKVSTQKACKPVKVSKLTTVHLEGIQRFKNYLTAKRYSKSTVKTYSEAIASFLTFMLKSQQRRLIITILYFLTTNIF